jgi:Zn-dependent protease
MDRGDLVVGVPKGAFRPSAIFLGLVALFVTAGVMSWRGFGDPGLNVFLFVAAGWLISLCLHEYAHALVAFRGGDVAVAARGYLTLNPLKYSHPFLSIVLPLLFVLFGGIGLPGGAVWVDKHNLRGRAWDSFVSFAGPAMNILFTLVLVVPFAIGVDVGAHPEFWAGVAFLGFLQMTASVLNLMPIPGVDGGNLVQPWLPPDWQRAYAKAAPYGMLLLFALLLAPRIGDAFWWLVFTISDAIGLPSDLYAEGFHLFRFCT